MRHGITGTFCAFWPCISLLAQTPAHSVALNPSFEVQAAFLAQDGFHVHAALVSTIASGSDYGLAYAGSTDGGRTWVRDRLMGWAHQINGIAADPGRILVLATRVYQGPWLFRSTDDGATWTSRSVAASTYPTLIPTSPTLHRNGANVVVGWTAYANGHYVWVNHSSDGGATWAPVDTPIDGGLNNLFDTVQFVATSTDVHAFFSDRNSGQPTYHNVSTDGGITWQPLATFVSNGELMASAAAGSTLLVADFSGQILRSTDNAITWNPSLGHGLPFPEALAANGSVVVATGNQTSGVQPPYINYVNVSTDHGATWRPAPLALPTFTRFSANPWTDGNTIVVHFTQPPLGTTSTVGLAVQSDDFGATWRSWTGPSNAGMSVTAQRAVAMTNAGATPYPTPLGQLLAYVAAGPTALGAGTTGTGGYAPSLDEIGLPTLGRTTTFQVGELLGGTLGLLGFSLAAPTPIQIGTATSWLRGAIASHVFVASGAANAPGVGTHTQPFVVPNSASLSGLRFTSQAFAFDSGNADGFVASRALETRLR